MTLCRVTIVRCNKHNDLGDSNKYCSCHLKKELHSSCVVCSRFFFNFKYGLGKDHEPEQKRKHKEFITRMKIMAGVEQALHYIIIKEVENNFLSEKLKTTKHSVFSWCKPGWPTLSHRMPILGLSRCTCLNTTSDKDQTRPQKNHKQHDKQHHHVHGGGAARPSSGVDLMNPCRERGERPSAYLFRCRRRSDLMDSINSSRD